MISCLTITQEGKLEELARAIHCFDGQTFEERELLILHDGSDRFHDDIRELLARYRSAALRVKRAPRGLTLGALRNLSVQLATYDIICQWDDDDLYHPKRLEAQYDALQREGADFCFFTDQLHFFETSRELFWDDWTVESYPMSLIQGTLMGRRDKLGKYGNVARGEDTPVVADLVQRGCRVAELRGRGYLYIYVYNGRNAWEYEHHRAISTWKGLRKARLLEREGELRRHLRDYGLELASVVFPHEDGALEIRI